MIPPFHATTICAVRRNNQTSIAGDGQVTVETHIVKGTARKVRRVGDGSVIAGFAGSAADAITLFEKFEDKLGAHRGQLRRASVELAKDWRTDRVLRRLEALMIVASRDEMFLISGNGDVIEPDEGVAAIGSGGTFAQSAATALMRHTEMSAREIAEAALGIAASICIYTNSNISVESIE